MTTAQGFESNTTTGEKEVTPMVGKLYYFYGLDCYRINGIFGVL